MIIKEIPIAKYMDSVIVYRNGKLIEELVNQVIGEIIEDQVVWFYYLKGKDGKLGAVLSEDILINITTKKNYTTQTEFQDIDNKIDPTILIEQDKEDFIAI